MTESEFHAKGPPVFIKDNPIYNYRLQRSGVVANTPRARQMKVRVKLDGNVTAFYYFKSDFYPDYKQKEAERRESLKTDDKPPITPKKPHQKVDITAPERDPEWAAQQPPPIASPDHTSEKGTHIKHYMINYMTKDGKVHVEKIAAKGIVTAITIFYFQHAQHQPAIIQVTCIL